MRFPRPLIFTLLWLASALASAETPQVRDAELKPQDRHLRATEIITHILGSYHYRNTPLSDELSSAIFDNYLNNLDPNHSFFIQEDMNRFIRHRDRLDDALRQPDLSAAFEIFMVYRQRVRERAEHARQLLDGEFDFSKDEVYYYDRRELPWPVNHAEQDDLWRQRVKNDVLSLRLAEKQEREITNTLRERYARLATSTFQLNSDDVFQAFINAYTTAIEPHTAYFSPRTSENFDISMRLSLEGIGAVLSGETDYTVVQQIVPGGPAAESGELKAEDKIIGVGQGEDGEIVDVIGWRLDDVVDLIRGPKGTVVRLEILPKGSGPEGPSKIIMLIRNKINLEQQAAKSHVIELPGGSRIGVIEIPAFYMDFAAHARGDRDYRSTTRDVRRLITELEQSQVSGIIIDLRGNGGGSLNEAVELTGLFIESGPVVQTKDASGNIEINEDPDPQLVYGGPLAVLVDRHSASASEIFAGAIQDYRRGIIIGEPTFGKGTVQNIVELSRFASARDEDLGRLKTTIAQFFRVSGGSNQYAGVTPDVSFPTASKSGEYGERSLDNALPWDKIKPARYMQANAPIDKFEVVRNRSLERIRTDPGFNMLVRKTELIEEQKEKKFVSLNLEQRRAERERLLRLQREVENQYRAAVGLKPLPEDYAAAEEEENAGLEETVEDSPQYDVMLQETARILNDLIVPASELPAHLHASDRSRPAYGVAGQ
jgi:carboxyl-terminal processing protease